MDPLSPNNINPSWGSSPPRSAASRSQAYASPARSISSLPPQQPASSPFREPKVFGAPSPSLAHPPASASASSEASGSGQQRQGGGGAGYLRVRMGALERNRKDLLIRFDANTNLPNYRAATYRNMQRSYVEFQRFAEQIQMTSPQTIISALPLASTSAVTDEEDDRLVRIALQRWFTRICEDPVLLKDEELRSFIESDFGYSPIPPATARRPMTTTSAVPQVLTAALSKVVRRGPLDEDDELQSARGALEKLEERWGAAAAAVGNLGKTRRAMALANAEMGGKYVSLSTVESDPGLAQAERKVGRTLEQLSGMSGAQAASENVVLSDSLGYQALNARAAKDALSQRTQILEDSQNATKNAINKRRNVERMKGSSNINPAKVDDALHEMEDANTLEDQLSSRLNAISQNLHVSLRAHSRQAHEDVATTLLENARLTIGYHKHLLRELEALKPELAKVGASGPISTISTTSPPPAPATPSKAPQMAGSRPYQSPPRSEAPLASGEAGGTASRSMFLPPAAAHATPPRVPAASAAAAHAQPPQAGPGPARDPLAPPMAQSMMLPPHQNGQPRQPQTQTLGRQQGRRLDERQAAKMLAGGF